MLVSYPLAFLVIRTIKETNYDTEKVVYVDDVKKDRLEKGAAEHHPTGASDEKSSMEKEKESEKDEVTE